MRWAIDAALVLAAVVVVTGLDAVRVSRPAIDALARYSPARLEHGAVWTVPLSALLVGHPTMLGLTTVFAILVFLPLCLVVGPRVSLLAGLAGHCGATLFVAAVVIPAAAAGSGEAARVVRMGDYGASAFLAALAGAAVVLLWRRVRLLGCALAAGLVMFFGTSLLTHTDLMHNVADVEHLVAIGVGALVPTCLVPAPPGREPASRSAARRGGVVNVRAR